MTPARKRYFIANWKMNHRRSAAAEFCSSFLTMLPPGAASAGIGIAPSYILIPEVASALAGSSVMVGSQSVHWLSSGAHTGEISVPMLQDFGASFAIVGHSERRQFYGETSEVVSKRALAAIHGGMLAIVCVGEQERHFRAGLTQEVVEEQLRESLLGLSAAELPRLIVAYEPVWAIGTGLAATPEIAQDVHLLIRGNLISRFGAAAADISIIYGGSATPENIQELCSMSDVDGALVGGASLKAESFSKLITEGLAAN